MPDFIELDFHDVETAKSGDAITVRTEINRVREVHVVDGGYLDCGERLLQTIHNHYGAPVRVDRVVLTHPDGDHAAGLRHVLENAHVGELWMLRPWLFAHELLACFPTYTSVARLQSRLRACYPHVAALEEIAGRRGITIREPLQGARIGAFTVLAPSRARYLNLVVRSEKTPEGIQREAAAAGSADWMAKAFRDAIGFMKSLWGEEVFSAQETSAENEMSLVQYADVDGTTILLTGDAGREALTEAANYARIAGLLGRGINRFQVPHHGSRRNVSSELLDLWLGPKLTLRPAPGSEKFTAIISSAKADKDHPRKAVVRAMHHRGGKVITTEEGDIRTSSPMAPLRAGWVPAQALPYPEEQEPA